MAKTLYKRGFFFYRFYFLLSFIPFVFSMGALAYLTPVWGKEKAPMDQAALGQSLEEIRAHIRLSQEKIAQLVDEVEHLKKDQKTLTTTLIETAAKTRAASERIAENEARLQDFYQQKASISHVLEARRADFFEVLAVLERIGIKPLPAILVHPEDASSAVRSAFLLGSAVPEMREQVQILTNLLNKLTRISEDIAQETKQLKQEIQNQIEGRKKLILLLAEKAKLQNTSEKELRMRRQESEALAKKAHSFEELLHALQRQERKQKLYPEIMKMKANFYASHDFDALHHALFRPISGKLVHYYSSRHKTGLQGELVEGTFEAIVTSPTHAIVAYAGPFRSYGKIIILDVGKNYHILLAGMGSINVEQGQIVLPGEPIGIMGTEHQNYTKIFNIENIKGKATSAKPMLYIEFRKGGKPIDPSLWWAQTLAKRK